MLRKCKTHGHKICLWCALQSVAFPIEHFIWEKLPLFRNVTALLGLA